jgi:exosome complex exonuclease DIS3/RRP44
MLRGNQKTTRFGKVTKKGALVTVVKEHYLREDVPCGFFGCLACAPFMDAAQAVSLEGVRDVLLLDTNVLLHQTDFLEALLFGEIDAEITVVAILLENVIAEVRHRSTSVHNRVNGWIAKQRLDGRRALVFFANVHHRETFTEKKEDETDNGAQDRAIRVATSWYAAHLKDRTCAVRLLSDDRENRSLAQRDGLHAHSVRSYMSQIYDGNRKIALSSMVYTPSSPLCWPIRHPYTSYVSSEMAAAGMQRGAYVSGMLLVSPYNMWEGRVVAKWRGTTQTIYIHGRHRMNRAIHGSIVCVQVLPPSLWMRLQDEHLADSSTDSESDLELEFKDQLEMALGDDSNDHQKITSFNRSVVRSSDISTDPLVGTDSKTSDQDFSDRRISGRVVAVLEQTSKHYCGSLEPLGHCAQQLENSTLPSKFVDESCSNLGHLENRDDAISERVALFRPMDPKIPPFLMRVALEGAMSDIRVLAAIDDWPVGSRFARGHLVRIMGRTGVSHVETACLLYERGITYWQDPWPAEVLASLPDGQLKISKSSQSASLAGQRNASDSPPYISDSSLNLSDLPTSESFMVEEGRLDLRHLVVCSIDPPGCTDIDDALHARLLSSEDVDQLISSSLDPDLKGNNPCNHPRFICF